MLFDYVSENTSIARLSPKEFFIELWIPLESSE